MGTEMTEPVVHTPGPWRLGRARTVVCDTPVPEMGGSDAVDYYGGHLICESVVTRNAVLIASSPTMFQLLKDFIAWDEKYPKSTIHPMRGERELDNLFERAKQAVAEVGIGGKDG